MRTRFLPLVVAILVTALDQLTKIWALHSLADGTEIPILGHVLSLRLTFNSGAAFSVGGSATWIITIIGLIAVGVIPVLIRRANTAMALTLAVVWGGAIGNVIDRLFRDPGVGVGHVVDFIKYGDWFIGNVADIALVAGLVLVVVLQLLAPTQIATHNIEQDDEPTKDTDTAAKIPSNASTAEDTAAEERDGELALTDDTADDEIATR
ncbi:signal peptidase II [Trueperella sp. LYQ143]|uniref:signal peptidase II n=1 Tax=unclassified Trueperella TaxID=2630174 RepID=UPI0039836ED1